ncbi:MAG: FG-GAP-like repeat-containing protein [Bryobacteraceae bacterium]
MILNRFYSWVAVNRKGARAGASANTKALGVCGLVLACAAGLSAQSVPHFVAPANYSSLAAPAYNPTMYWSAAGDFNGDGRMDLAASDGIGTNITGVTNINGFSVALANSTGGYAAPISKSVGLLMQGLQAADFNHDGLCDLVFEGAGGAGVLLATGNGDFAAPILIPVPFTSYNGAVGDFNGDGNPDVVITGSGGYAVALGTGTGAMQTPTLLPMPVGTFYAVVGDINNDGKLDFAGSATFLGNGDGSFQAPVNSALPYGAKLGDFNGDGLLDAVMIQTQAGPQDAAIFRLTIARGTGDGSFIAYFDWVFGTNAISGLASADYDRDGRPDVAIYDRGLGKLRVLSGTGNWLLGGDLYNVALPVGGAFLDADMDGNGSPDLVVAYYRDYYVLRNTHGNPPLVAQLKLSPASLIGGAASSTATVSLGGAAPAEGATVTLSSSDPSVAFLPAGTTVTIPAGANSATFPVSTSTVPAPSFSDITATWNGVVQSARLDVVPAYSLSAFTVNPGSQYGIFTASGTVTLDNPADAAAVIALTSSNPSLGSVPATVTIPAGATSASFKITLQPVTANTPVSISASLGGVTKTASITVLKPLDTVAISKAIYTAKSVQLKVDATSTSTATTITVHDPNTGALLGTLANAGGGKYNGTINVYMGTRTRITLKSALGGTVSGSVQVK